MVNLVRSAAVVAVEGLQKTEPSWVLKPVRMGMRTKAPARKEIIGRLVIMPVSVGVSMVG